MTDLHAANGMPPTDNNASSISDSSPIPGVPSSELPFPETLPVPEQTPLPTNEHPSSPLKVLFRRVKPKVKAEYEEKLKQERINTMSNIDNFVSKTRKVTVTKSAGQGLGLALAPTGPAAVVPGVLVVELLVGGPTAQTGLVNLGDQLLHANGQSLIGLPFEKAKNIIRGLAALTTVELELATVDTAHKPADTTPTTNFKLVNADANLTSAFTNTIKFTLKKKLSAPLGISVSPTLPGAVLPGVWVSALEMKDIENGESKDENEILMLGDQLMSINGQSLVGLTVKKITQILKDCSKLSEVQIELARPSIALCHQLPGGPPGMVVENGKIRSVESGGVADQAGFKAGQRILMVQDVSVYPDHKKIKNFFKQENPLTVWTIEPRYAGDQPPSRSSRSMPGTPNPHSHRGSEDGIDITLSPNMALDPIEDEEEVLRARRHSDSLPRADANEHNELVHLRAESSFVQPSEQLNASSTIPPQLQDAPSTEIPPDHSDAFVQNERPLSVTSIVSEQARPSVSTDSQPANASEHKGPDYPSSTSTDAELVGAHGGSEVIGSSIGNDHLEDSEQTVELDSSASTTGSFDDRPSTIETSSSVAPSSIDLGETAETIIQNVHSNRLNRWRLEAERQELAELERAKSLEAIDGEIKPEEPRISDTNESVPRTSVVLPAEQQNNDNVLLSPTVADSFGFEFQPEIPSSRDDLEIASDNFGFELNDDTTRRFSQEGSSSQEKSSDPLPPFKAPPPPVIDQHSFSAPFKPPPPPVSSQSFQPPLPISDSIDVAPNSPSPPFKPPPRPVFIESTTVVASIGPTTSSDHVSHVDYSDAVRGSQNVDPQLHESTSVTLDQTFVSPEAEIRLSITKNEEGSAEVHTVLADLPSSLPDSDSTNESDGVGLGGLKEHGEENGVKQSKFKPLKPAEKDEYESKLTQTREFANANVDNFLSKTRSVTVNKRSKEGLGFMLLPTGPQAVMPGVVIDKLLVGGPAASTGLVNVGDQVLSVDGTSLVGLTYAQAKDVLRGVRKDTEVTLELVALDIAHRPLKIAPVPHEWSCADASLTPVYTNLQKCTVNKSAGTPLSFSVSPTLPGAFVPGMWVSQLGPEAGDLKLGDQVMAIDGQSLTGLNSKQVKALFQEYSKATEVHFDVARPVEPVHHQIQAGGDHGLTIDNGVVKNVAKNSLAEHAGFVVGQRVLTIQGESVYPKTKKIDTFLKGGLMLDIWSIVPRQLSPSPALGADGVLPTKLNPAENDGRFSLAHLDSGNYYYHDEEDEEGEGDDSEEGESENSTLEEARRRALLMGFATKVEEEEAVRKIMEGSSDVDNEQKAMTKPSTPTRKAKVRGKRMKKVPRVNSMGVIQEGQEMSEEEGDEEEDEREDEIPNANNHDLGVGTAVGASALVGAGLLPQQESDINIGGVEQGAMHESATVGERGESEPAKGYDETTSAFGLEFQDHKDVSLDQSIENGPSEQSIRQSLSENDANKQPLSQTQNDSAPEELLISSNDAQQVDSSQNEAVIPTDTRNSLSTKGSDEGTDAPVGEPVGTEAIARGSLASGEKSEFRRTDGFETSVSNSSLISQESQTQVPFQVSTTNHTEAPDSDMNTQVDDQGDINLENSTPGNVEKKKFKKLRPRDKDVYENKLTQPRNFTSANVDNFLSKMRRVVVPKSSGQGLGFIVLPTGPQAVVPGVVVDKMMVGGPAASTGLVNIGDQVLTVNSKSLIGLSYSKAKDIIREVKPDTEVVLELVALDVAHAPITIATVPHEWANCDPSLAAAYDHPEQCTVIKQVGSPLSFSIYPTLPGAVVPGVWVSHLGPESGDLELGDQLMSVDGHKLTGLNERQIAKILKECNKSSEVHFEVVRCVNPINHQLQSGGAHGLTVDNGGVVTNVVAGSPAQQAKFVVGQRILTIQGESVFPKTRKITSYLKSGAMLNVWSIQQQPHLHASSLLPPLLLESSANSSSFVSESVDLSAPSTPTGYYFQEEEEDDSVINNRDRNLEGDEGDDGENLSADDLALFLAARKKAEERRRDSLLGWATTEEEKAREESRTVAENSEKKSVPMKTKKQRRRARHASKVARLIALGSIKEGDEVSEDEGDDDEEDDEDEEKEEILRNSGVISFAIPDSDEEREEQEAANQDIIDRSEHALVEGDSMSVGVINNEPLEWTLAEQVDDSLPQNSADSSNISSSSNGSSSSSNSSSDSSDSSSRSSSGGENGISGVKTPKDQLYPSSPISTHFSFDLASEAKKQAARAALLSTKEISPFAPSPLPASGSDLPPLDLPQQAISEGGGGVTAFTTEHIANYKDLPALLDPEVGVKLTYGDLGVKLRTVARRLRDHGLRRGDVLLLACGFHIYNPLILHAALLVGAVVTCCDPASNMLARHLSESRASFVCTTAQYLDEIKLSLDNRTLVHTIVVLDPPHISRIFCKQLRAVLPFEGLLHPDFTEELAFADTLDAVRFLEPKPVRLTHTEMVANLQLCSTELPLEQGDVVLVCLPFFQLCGQSLVNVALRVGCTILFPPANASPSIILAMIKQHSVSFVVAEPSLAEVLTAEITRFSPAPGTKIVGPYDLSTLKAICGVVDRRDDEIPGSEESDVNPDLS